MIPAFVLPLIVIVLYLVGLPSTVQSVDSGELVTALVSRTNVHPPGYPLWLWLNTIWQKVFFFVGSPFFRAAAFSALCSAGTLALLAGRSRLQAWRALVVVALALALPFWTNALLAEVFALAGLFCAAILALAMRPARAARYGPALVWLWATGTAHHPILVFLAPVMLLIGIKRQPVRLGAHFLSAIVAQLALYATLLARNPLSPLSWGELTSADALISHMLRKDYGVLQLAAGESTFFLPANLLAGLIDGLPVFFLLALGFMLTSRRRLRHPFTLAVSAALVAYVLIFFTLSNVAPYGPGSEIVRRFWVVPLVMAAFLARWLLEDPAKLERLGKHAPRLLVALSALMIAGSAVRARPFVQEIKSTVIEDYATNLLRVAPAERATVIVSRSDTSYFSLRYVQNVLGVRKEITVIAAPLLFHEWYSAKLLRQLPELKFDAARIAATRELDFSKDLIEPNLGRIDFVFEENFHDRNFKTTYLPVGRVIGKGSGIAIDRTSEEKLVLRSRPSLDLPARAFSSTQAQWAKYAFINLAEGLKFHEAGRTNEALSAFVSALSNVPYCIPALINVCSLNPTPDCEEKTRELSERYFNYY